MKKIYIILFAMAVSATSFGQSRALMGQYFQNIPSSTPALAGANDYLDLRSGYRKQWAGGEGTPTTYYLSGYYAIKPKLNAYKKNSLRVSNPELYQPQVKEKFYSKLGVGGYVLQDKRGPIKQTETMMALAAHIPLAERTYISLGLSSGVNNYAIDLPKLILKEQFSDPVYNAYQSNGSSMSYIHFNNSLALYNDKYYITYGIMNFAQTVIGGNSDIEAENQTRHNILAGYRFYFSEFLEVIPSTFLRLENATPTFFDLGVRVRYRENIWAGISYRNDQSYIGMFGLGLTKDIDLGYSFEYKASEFESFNQGSHEVTLGLALFNKANYKSIW